MLTGRKGESLATCVNPLPAPPAADRILVLRLGALGDVVRTLPAVSALRAAYPGAHLAWLVEPPARGAVEGQPWVDEVLEFPRGRLSDDLRRLRLGRFAAGLAGFVGALRARRFDLVVDFHAIAKSALLARASGAPARVGYAAPLAREGAAWLSTARAVLAARRLSRFARNLALVEFLGVPAAPRPAPLRVPPEARRALAEALGPAPAPIVIHPGTSPGTPHKRWSAAGWAAVARGLAGDGRRVLVSHGPGGRERALADAILAAADGAAQPAPATGTLAELAALLEHAQLFLGSDSGPLHVASLVGTPVVQLLGPTDPVENAPHPGTPWRSVRVPVACSPCRRGCAAATCMARIAPDAVLDAARALLAGHGRG
jgi:ADP-heptose:LPS heptosyltransferase